MDFIKIRNMKKEELPFFEKYDQELLEMLDSAEFTAKVIAVTQIDEDFFIMMALDDKNCEVYKSLSDILMPITLNEIYDLYYSYIESKSSKSLKPNRTINFTDSFKSYLNLANEERIKAESETITTLHVFKAILNKDNGENKAQKIFQKIGASYNKLKKCTTPKFMEDIDSGIDLAFDLGNPKTQVKIKCISQKTPNVKNYCINLNELVKNGKIDELIGRRKESDEIIRVLGRRKKNNAILVGNSGVGKTAIAENLAFRIVNEDVPEFLSGKEVLSLDMTSLIAGTTLRGMFEERVKGVIDELKTSNNFILFIDNIGDVLYSSGKNDYDISAMLSNALENGEIQVIGTANFSSYRKTFDKDQSLARKFQKIYIEDPSLEDSIAILKGIKKYYESFHKVEFSDNIIELVVKLSSQYLPERKLPDSAIDIIDEVGASVIKEKKDNAYIITKNDILNLFSVKTGIPVNEITEDDKKRMSGLADNLKKEIIGQDEPIDTIALGIKRNRLGLSKKGCAYSAMMIGSTGVGKTLLAKKLAKELFGSEDSLIRFDMSEYSDKSSVSKLIGSNPGYIGYEEGGRLTEAIKNKKYCVLLIDEIEKADSDVYNIFLQILDEGFLTDNSGMKVDFHNVIVLFTSNVGSKNAIELGKNIGFVDETDKTKRRIMEKELRRKFPPEFLNRIDNVIHFNPLDKKSLKSIIKLEISKLSKTMETSNYRLKVNDSVIDIILDNVMENKEYGARQIRRAIQDMIENKIADKLLSSENDTSEFEFVTQNENIVLAE